jgi:uncharacterized damage-inducible protein DinB
MSCYAESLRKSRQFLNNIIKDFKPEHETFRPTPDMWTVAQQIRHIGRCAYWFRKGGFENHWEMDFEGEMKEMAKPVTLKAAIAELDSEYNALIAFLESVPPAVLAEPLEPNPIFPIGVPRSIVVDSLCEHTAHHRGALSVYLRLLGIKPTMAYE